MQTFDQSLFQLYKSVSSPSTRHCSGPPTRTSSSCASRAWQFTSDGSREEMETSIEIPGEHEANQSPFEIERIEPPGSSSTFARPGGR